MNGVGGTSRARQEEAIEAEIRARYPAPQFETTGERRKRFARINSALYRHRKRVRESTLEDVSEPRTGSITTSTAALQQGQNAINVDSDLDVSLDGEFATPPNETPAAKKRRLARKLEAFHRRNLQLQTVAQPETLLPEPSAAPSLPQQPSMLHFNPDDLRLRRETEAAWQRRLIARHGSSTLRVGLGYHEHYNHPERHRLGSQRSCAYCSAPKWPGEAPTVCCNSAQWAV
ncbi:uncharacterized protein LOC120903402 [Anopheles arabiensis]|uniref:uncharacterized protein LOC120903402 n=1 Tax=Anopheles arabiensis TaxID=7173 RepID=UPI001AAD3F96|nr:uncharacterized protein LOC120903402 [Anopheles arabiensis]